MRRSAADARRARRRRGGCSSTAHAQWSMRSIGLFLAANPVSVLCTNRPIGRDRLRTLGVRGPRQPRGRPGGLPARRDQHRGGPLPRRSTIVGCEIVARVAGPVQVVDASRRAAAVGRLSETTCTDRRRQRYSRLAELRRRFEPPSILLDQYQRRAAQPTIECDACRAT